MKNNHIDEADIFSLYLGEDEKSGAMEHVSQCAECRREYERFAEEARMMSSDVYSAHVNGIGERFWSRQKDGILNRINEMNEKDSARAWTLPRLAPLAAAALVILLAAVITLIKPDTTERKTAGMYAMSKQDMEDNKLLMEIETLKELPAIDGLGFFVELNENEDAYQNDDQGALDTRRPVKA